MLPLLVAAFLAQPPLVPTPPAVPAEALGALNLRLDQPTPEGPWAARAAAVLAQRLPGLRLGEPKVSETHARVAVSFALLGPDGAPVFERRAAVVLKRDGTALRLHFDGLPAPQALPGAVSASDAAAIATTLGGRADATVAGWLAAPYGGLEPAWRVALVVVPFLDHRWVYVSRATGELLRWTPSAKDGAVTGAVTP